MKENPSENHCTAWPEVYWSHCCKAHDEAYTLQLDKAQADKELLSCVADSADGILVVPTIIVAWLMYSAVRVFGRAFYKRK